MDKTICKLLAVGILLFGGLTLSFAEGKNMAMTGEMSPEQKAMMDRMQEYSTPNQNHEVLKGLAGNWTTVNKFWMDAKGEPEQSAGTSEAKIIMNGRFLESTFKGTAMGQPFEGRGIYGYDNIQKKYQGIWFDNMGTGMMESTGQYDGATKTISESGTLSCPITNGPRAYRAKTTIIDADHYTFETFMNDEKDGQEFRSMLITYTRVK